MMVRSPIQAPARPLVAGFMLAALALLAGPAGQPASAQSTQALRSAAEESGFQRYTRHDELMDYLRAVRATSPEMRLGSYGETFEGREIPYAIFSRPAVTQPWEAWATGKPVLVLAANVHGNERTYRESLLILVRDLATPGTEVNRWLDDLVVVVVPTINPDGFEASERGSRGNAWGIDMNRDYAKLEQPALVHYSRNVLQRWRPHLFVDGHNGGAYPYNLTYQCTSNAGAERSLTVICDQEIFPLIDRRMLENGFESWYYARGTETRWMGGGSDIRIGRNYGGLANSIAILFESPGRQTMETAVRAGVVGYAAVMEYARENAAHMMATVDAARQATAAFGDGAWSELAVQQEYGPEAYPARYKIEVGQGADRRVIEVRSDSMMTLPVPTVVRPRPYAYILPRQAIAAVALLQRHGIALEVLAEPVTLEVDVYSLTDITYQRVYDHAAATRVTVGDVVTVEQTFPAGSFVVPTDQMLGRLVMHLLEPETNDNVIYWNTMDAWLPKAQLQQWQAARANGQAAADAPLVPIYKLMDRVPLPSRIID
jgi:hypothetical protein